MSAEEGTPVQLYIYDLSKGAAPILSSALLGHRVEGIWHTSIVVYEWEYFYSNSGITSCAPGSTQLGQPLQIEQLGTTFVPFQVFLDYIDGLSSTTYMPSQYQLLTHNCNHFSEEVAQFMCGAHIPKHILEQPERDLPPQFRQYLIGILGQLVPGADQAVYTGGVRHSRRESPEYHTLNNQIDEARIQSAELEHRRSTLAEKLARKERKKEKKRKKLRDQGIEPTDEESDMAEAVEVASRGEEMSRAGPSSDTLQLEADERRQEEMRKRARDPPIVYKDVDAAQEFEKLSKELEGMDLSAEDKQSLDELQQYLVQGEGSWVLGDEFLAFIGRVLTEQSFSSTCRTAALRCLAAGALRDDVSLLLHQDRRSHTLMNYAQHVDQHPLPEQIALALFMCNLFENISSSEWLLYISEWEYCGQPLSNIRATTKVCVHATLSEEPELRDIGTALMHNIATKERFQLGKRLRDLLPKGAKSKVFDEVCVELAMALLQLLQAAPPEELLFRALKALARLAHHSQEIGQLLALVGVSPHAYRGTSPRVDEQIDLMMQKVK